MRSEICTAHFSPKIIKRWFRSQLCMDLNNILNLCLNWPFWIQKKWLKNPKVKLRPILYLRVDLLQFWALTMISAKYENGKNRGLFHKTIYSWQGDSWHRSIPWHFTWPVFHIVFCKFSAEMTHCHKSFTSVTTNLGNQYFTVNQGSLNFFSALNFSVSTACFTLKFLNHVTNISDNRTMQKNRLKYD